VDEMIDRIASKEEVEKSQKMVENIVQRPEETYKIALDDQ
jgi:hypothetical protein